MCPLPSNILVEKKCRPVILKYVEIWDKIVELFNKMHNKMHNA